ncbi:MAG: branched-chain amino acid ABC transporter permease [Candidatus Berkiellales bacterium]
MVISVLAQLIVSGASIGMIYTLIAYGFQLTFSTSKSINFGQGELVMVSTFFTLTLFNSGIPYLLCVLLGILFGALLGLFVERVFVRLSLEQKTEGWVLTTIIWGLFAMSVAENIWGKDDHPFPTPFSSEPILFKGVVITAVEISIVCGALAFMILIELFKRKTMYGKAVLAVALNRDSAELVGISPRMIIAYSYALSGAVAGFAGILVAPITTVGVNMSAALILKAFSVAVVAGLDSGFGVVIIGAAIGIIENLTSYYVGSGWREAPGLVFLILALALRPTGIFGKAVIRKV